MYASELRTCGLGAIVAVLLGGSVGFGWHFFADSGRAVAAAIAPLAQQAASNPPLACPPPSREGQLAMRLCCRLYLAPTTSPTQPMQGAHSGSHIQHAPVALDRCRVRTGLMVARG